MYSFSFYESRPGQSIFAPLPIKRDWMDKTDDAHAYKCFPVSLANGMGYGLSFPEDISFIWDGVDTSRENGHVTVLKGEKYIHTNRNNATVSFITGIVFITDPDVSMLNFPVPNQHIPGVSPFTNLISTSFFKGEWQVAWKITEPNKEITIPAGTPVIAIMPISLGQLNNTVAIKKNISDLPANFFPGKEYADAVYALNQQGKWTNFYRDGLDHKGNKLGEHEIKAFRFRIDDGEPINCGDKDK